MRNRFEEFVACAVEINRCIQRIKDQEMQRFGLRSRHTMCLYFLGCHPEGLSVGALADLTKEDKAAVSRCLGQLAEKGLARSEDSGGKRAYRARHFLTPEGQALAARMNEAIAQALQFGGSGLSDEAREAYYAAAEQILKNLKAYLVED